VSINAPWGARVLSVTPLPTIVQRQLDARLRRVVDDFGQLFARYGLALTTGRVFGLLLISDDPLSLDDIATLLGVSKSSTSVTARELERLGIARRFAIAGSRRIVYELGDDLEPIFESQLTRVRQQLAVLDRAEPLLAAGRARDRLQRMQQLHEFAVRETEGMRERWRQRKDAP
jgi:DNA-binding transcriptional regulator GbsR (MarR family)